MFCLFSLSHFLFYSFLSWSLTYWRGYKINNYSVLYETQSNLCSIDVMFKLLIKIEPIRQLFPPFFCLQSLVLAGLAFTLDSVLQDLEVIVWCLLHPALVLPRCLLQVHFIPSSGHLCPCRLSGDASQCLIILHTWINYDMTVPWVPSNSCPLHQSYRKKFGYCLWLVWLD